MIGVVGLIARDIVDAGAPRLGGGAWYCSRALAVLGQKGVVATKYAREDHRLAAALHGLGLDVVWRPAPTTAIFVIANRGDRREMAIESTGEPFTPGDARTWIAEALGPADWVHAPGLSRADVGSPGTELEFAL